LLATGKPVAFGCLTLMQIGRDRYHRELQKGINEVFRLGPIFSLEIPHHHVGPWTDFAEE